MIEGFVLNRLLSFSCLDSINSYKIDSWYLKRNMKQCLWDDKEKNVKRSRLKKIRDKSNIGSLKWETNSATRFGEILPLEIFFGEIWKSLLYYL